MEEGTFLPGTFRHEEKLEYPGGTRPHSMITQNGHKPLPVWSREGGNGSGAKNS